MMMMVNWSVNFELLHNIIVPIVLETELYITKDLNYNHELP